MHFFIIKVTNFDKPYTLGVVYRPPNGSEIAALAEIDNIMQILPNERVLVFGDYNFDLFKPESQKFESSLYENNMIPLSQILLISNRVVIHHLLIIY